MPTPNHTPSDVQLARLPRWAQDHVAALRRRVAELEAAQQPQQGTPVAHNPYGAHLGGTITYLDRTDPVRFALDGKDAAESRDYIDVQLLSGGTLDITCDGALMLLPRASNRALAQVADRWAKVPR